MARRQGESWQPASSSSMSGMTQGTTSTGTSTSARGGTATAAANGAWTRRRRARRDAQTSQRQQQPQGQAQMHAQARVQAQAHEQQSAQPAQLHAPLPARSQSARQLPQRPNAQEHEQAPHRHAWAPPAPAYGDHTQHDSSSFPFPRVVDSQTAPRALVDVPLAQEHARPQRAFQQQRDEWPALAPVPNVSGSSDIATGSSAPRSAAPTANSRAAASASTPQQQLRTPPHVKTTATPSAPRLKRLDLPPIEVLAPSPRSGKATQRTSHGAPSREKAAHSDLQASTQTPQKQTQTYDLGALALPPFHPIEHSIYWPADAPPPPPPCTFPLPAAPGHIQPGQTFSEAGQRPVRPSGGTKETVQQDVELAGAVVFAPLPSLHSTAHSGAHSGAHSVAHSGPAAPAASLSPAFVRRCEAEGCLSPTFCMLEPCGHHVCREHLALVLTRPASTSAPESAPPTTATAQKEKERGFSCIVCRSKTTTIAPDPSAVAFAAQQNGGSLYGVQARCEAGERHCATAQGCDGEESKATTEKKSETISAWIEDSAAAGALTSTSEQAPPATTAAEHLRNAAATASFIRYDAEKAAPVNQATTPPGIPPKPAPSKHRPPPLRLDSTMRRPAFRDAGEGVTLGAHAARAQQRYLATVHHHGMGSPRTPPFQPAQTVYAPSLSSPYYAPSHVFVPMPTAPLSPMAYYESMPPPMYAYPYPPTPSDGGSSSSATLRSLPTPATLSPGVMTQAVYAPAPMSPTEPHLTPPGSSPELSPTSPLSPMTPTEAPWQRTKPRGVRQRVGSAAVSLKKTGANWPVVKLENIPFRVTVSDIEAWLDRTLSIARTGRPAGLSGRFPAKALLPPRDTVPSPIHIILHRATGRTLPHCYIETRNESNARYLVSLDPTHEEEHAPGERTDARARDDQLRIFDRRVRMRLEKPGEFLRDIYLQDVYFARVPAGASLASAPLPSAPRGDNLAIPFDVLTRQRFDHSNRTEIDLLLACAATSQAAEGRSSSSKADRPFERPYLHMCDILETFPWHVPRLATPATRDVIFKAYEQMLQTLHNLRDRPPREQPLSFERNFRLLVSTGKKCQGFTTAQLASIESLATEANVAEKSRPTAAVEKASAALAAAAAAESIERPATLANEVSESWRTVVPKAVELVDEPTHRSASAPAAAPDKQIHKSGVILAR